MTGETKHTPGPWNLIWWGNEQYPYPLSVLADNDGKWITRDGTVSSEANARLIAAAPDMLEALKGLLAVVDDSQGVAGFHLNGSIAAWGEFEEIEFAQAALAKAEGRDGAA